METRSRHFGSAIASLKRVLRFNERPALNLPDVTTGPIAGSVSATNSAKVEAVVAPKPPQASFDQVMANAGGFSAWFDRRRNESRQFTEVALSHRADLHEAARHEVETALEIARDIRAHSFNFLGSGPFVPVDPDRLIGLSGYQPIDWFLDPVRNLRFPKDVPHKYWDLHKMRPLNADIKYPWELSRCQHFLALGQAYILTGEAKFATELADQCADFSEANPAGIGINWTCTMDVALRAANWCLALALVLNCPNVTAERWEAIYRHLYETGAFILTNLENHYEVTSNHFLSNVVGLHILASEFSDLEVGREWDAFARNAVEQEIVVQILPDGADYESSVPYHRLVTELFLGSWRLAEIQGRPLTSHYRDILIRMIVFLKSVLRPDGRMPVIGDADDGRFMIASGYGRWDPADGRHILTPAALALGQPDWLAGAGAISTWEAFWWGFAPSTLRQRAPSEPKVETCFFEQAGLIVSRSLEAGSYLLISNSIVGTKGFGNHKHNDLLSFEYHDRNVPLIVDPGSHVYTSDFNSRNAFRSTASHNTLMVDGIEQNEFKPEWLFRMFAKATPSHIHVAPSERGVTYEGSHNGYTVQLSEPVTHQRQFTFDAVEGELDILDTLKGVGTHDFVWHFHFDPGVKAELAQGGGAVDLKVESKAWRVTWSDRSLQAALMPGDVSPSYGVKRPSTALRVSCRANLANDHTLKFKFRRWDVTP